MISTLAGPNSFLIREELAKFIQKFTEEHGDLALERVDGEEADFERLQEAATALPFLSPKKLVVLRAPGAQKKWQEKAEQILKNVPATNDIIIVEAKLDKRSAYYKLLKSKTEFRELGELSENGLADWLVRAAKEQGGALSGTDARYLIQRVGPNQQFLSRELDKLLIYNSKITRPNIDLLTDMAPQSTIFQLLDSAFSGNIGRALQLYDEQRAIGTEPQQIVAMLGWQLHVLAVLKAAGNLTLDEIAAQTKISPYVLGKSRPLADKLAVQKLKSLVSLLVDIDSGSKQRPLDLDEALRYYLVKLAN